MNKPVLPMVEKPAADSRMANAHPAFFLERRNLSGYSTQGQLNAFSLGQMYIEGIKATLEKEHAAFFISKPVAETDQSKLLVVRFLPVENRPLEPNVAARAGGLLVSLATNMQDFEKAAVLPQGTPEPFTELFRTDSYYAIPQEYVDRYAAQ